MYKIAFKIKIVVIRVWGWLFEIFIFCLAKIIRAEIHRVRVISGALNLSIDSVDVMTCGLLWGAYSIMVDRLASVKIIIVDVYHL